MTGGIAGQRPERDALCGAGVCVWKWRGTHAPSLPVEQAALRDGVNGLASRMYSGRPFYALREDKRV